MKKILFTCLLFSHLLAHDSPESVTSRPVQELFSQLIKAVEQQEWNVVDKTSQEILKDYKMTAFAKEALFYLGVSSFQQKDYEYANQYFSNYLKDHSSSQHFQEVVEYKLEIAHAYKKGARKHLMGLKAMPKWLPALEDALVLYDEVIAILPHHDFAAQALLEKGTILFKDMDKYREAIDAYQTLTRRFPRHSFAIESFLHIGKVYLKQCENESTDQTFLDLAEINLKKFEAAFPGEERILEAENTLLAMREVYANDLFQTGAFYEKTKKKEAARLYYQSVMSKYPETKASLRAAERYALIQPS